jgi:hypothetical protein
VAVTHRLDRAEILAGILLKAAASAPIGRKAGTGDDIGEGGAGVALGEISPRAPG